MRIHCTLNGSPSDLDVAPLERAIDVLRRVGLTGTKEGCGEGECGSCTILMNGRPVNACLVIASQMDGGVINTVEGLASDGALSPLQQAFVDRGATQCGICTPGILMAAEYLLDEARRARIGPDGAPLPRFEAVAGWAATADAPDSPALDCDVRTALAGNICRCTGYDSIVRAVKDALGAGAGRRSRTEP